MKKIACVGNLILAFGLTFGFNAQALTLGRLSVLSFLGQPLVAEIEVPEISPEESNSLRVGIANAEAFKSAGLDYSAVVAELSITGKRRADGRVILEVRGSQPVTAPFVDLVLEITWNAGRMLRDYTVLLDPPATANQALIVPAPTLPMLSASSLPPAAASPTPATAIAAKPQNDEAEQRIPKQAVSTKAKLAAKNSIKIKKGDTAAAIAAANKPEGVSLDQMLVAMLRSNPQAFEAGNVNRLKAGAVMEMPTAEDATATKVQEAKNNIKAQARDFNEYRRRLANNAPASVEKESSRQASGKVVAKVQDRQAVKPSDDRLTLAKPAQAGNAAAEDKIAKERAAADVNARANELKKNMTELSQLAAKAPAVAQTLAQATPPAPVSASSAASVPVALAASAPQPAASAPPIPAVKPTRPPVPPAPEPSFLDQILTNSLVLPIGGVAVFVFLVGALLVVRRRRAQSVHTMQDESIGFSQTRQPPTDTIFGPMGASEVDTQETITQASTSSAAYPPSQLSTVTGDVDPIAEADVYLAYNRDVQAEEILKEAKRNAPKRIDVQAKLLEIYAKRQDMEAFDAGAQDLHLLTDGEGEDWAKVRMLARDLGSTHPLFKVSGSAFAVSSESVSTNSSAYSANSLSFLSTPIPPAVTEEPRVEALEPAASAASPNFGGGLIDFDLSSLTLDLPGPTDSPMQATDSMPVFAADVPEDPKLALAEEYLSIGDKVGARSLIEEVLQQNAHPQTIALAQQMLMRLG